MFAVHDARTTQTSPTRHAHSNGSHQDMSAHRMKSSSQRGKMVMPPIMRLDSTGEVTSYEKPGHTSSPRKTDSRRQRNTMHGLFGKLLSNSSPSSSKQLAMSRVKAEVSALDELYNSKQALERTSMAGLRPHWKSAKMTHSGPPCVNRYGRWCGANPNYPVLPQGVFPCHVFNALQSQQQQQQHIFLSPSSRQAPKCVLSMPKSLTDTVRKFSAQSREPTHHPQDRQSSESSATGTSDESSISNHNDVSVCAFEKPCTLMGSTADQLFVNIGSDSVPSVSDITQAAPKAESSVYETLLNDNGSSCTQDNLNDQNSISVSNENSSMQGQQNGNSVVIGYRTLCEKDTGNTQFKTAPSNYDDQHIHNCSHEALAHKTDLCLKCNQCGTAENSSKMCDCEVKVKDKVQEQERTGTWCLQLLTQKKNMATGAETEKDSSNLGSDRIFVAKFQVQPVEEEEEEDWDDCETDDDSDELDFMSQADAVGIFMLGGLTVNSILSTPYKQRQREQEEDKEEKEDKSPPKPCPEATNRWNQLYPSDAPQHRASKVQFICGKQVDAVHMFERGEGETLTMMEIQKARDLSRQNKGKAAKLLQRKDFREDSPESAIPRKTVDSACNLAAETDAVNSEMCDACPSSPVEGSPSEVLAVADGDVNGVTVGGTEPDTEACAIAKSPAPQSVCDELDAGDFRLDSLRGGSESSDCSDEEESESEEDDDDDEGDDDDDIVFE